MGFNNAYALWSLPLLGLIVLMYMLKQQHEEMEISSLYLWEKAMGSSEVKKPWQRLKNNILMLMQLLAAFMMIMALSGPYLTKGKMLGGNIIIAIDRSGSMNALYGEKSRLDTAKAMAEKAVREAGSSSVFTVVSVDKGAKVEISGTGDKEAAVKAIRGIEKTGVQGSLKDDLSLIKAMYKQFPSAHVLIYTDEAVPLEDMAGEIIALGGKAENAGITHISYSRDGEKYTVLVRVGNNSEAAAERELALYEENSLLGLTEIVLEPGESRNIMFEGIDTGYKYLWAELTEEDALLEDNRAYLVLQSEESKKVLLFSEGNIFIEKALSSIEGLEVYKTDDINVSDDDYDLYIFDGMMPSSLPQKGSLFFINPGGNNPYFKAGETTAGGRAEILSHGLNQHADGYSFYIGKMRDIEKPYWADALIKAGQNTAAGAGIFEGRRIGYTAFDIHDSDFALNTAFPIFMYNMAAYLTDMEQQGKPYYCSGETIPLDFAGGAEEAAMENPRGLKASLNKGLLSYGYDDTRDTGIYKLSYNKGEDSGDKIFAVNFPGEEAANAFKESWEGDKKPGDAGGNLLSGLNLRSLIIIFVLLLLAGEWMVYIRGN